MTPSRPRAVLYLRLSQVTEASSSIAGQRADLLAHAEREGWDVVAEFDDADESGGYDREKATTALRMLKDGTADVLAVWKFDRWSRQGLGAVARLIEALDAREERGDPALFVALNDGLTSAQPAWRIIAAVLAEAARMERENIRFRVRSAIRRNKLSGRWTGGTIPIGYAAAPHPAGPGAGRVLVRSDREADVITSAARRVVAGESLYATTAWLNSTDVRPRRAATWTLQSLRQVLTGPAIVGRMTLDGHVLVDDDGLPLEVWPPAIPVDLWHATRAVLADRRAARPVAGERARRQDARLLSGLATCADCGSPLYVRRNGGTPARGDRPARPGVAIYACSAKSNGRECGGVSVTAERLEEHVTERFLAAVGRFEVVRAVEHEVPALALVEAESALKNVSDRLADLTLAEDVEESLLAQRRALRTRVRELRAESGSGVEVEYVPTGETFAEVWESAETAERRRLLNDAVELLAVSKGRRGAHGLDPSRVCLEFVRGPIIEPDEGNSRGPASARAE